MKITSSASNADSSSSVSSRIRLPKDRHNFGYGVQDLSLPSRWSNCRFMAYDGLSALQQAADIPNTWQQAKHLHLTNKSRKGNLERIRRQTLFEPAGLLHR